MSQKITSKNLSYDSNLPPFLATLRAQASGAGGPDPLLAQQRRSAKKRSSSEEAEDAPLVVDEDGNVVNLEVDDDGVVKNPKDQDSKTDDAAADTKGSDVKKVSDSKSAIGGRKRKVGKVIGDAANESSERVEKNSERTRDDDNKEPPKERRTKKKAKKIKLSFDEEEG